MTNNTYKYTGIRGEYQIELSADSEYVSGNKEYRLKINIYIKPIGHEHNICFNPVYGHIKQETDNGLEREDVDLLFEDCYKSICRIIDSDSFGDVCLKDIFNNGKKV